MPLAFVGGLMGTTGGDGWGPIVTSSLVGAGKDPRTTLGSVNRAELFLSILDATVKVLSTGRWPCNRRAGSRTFCRLYDEALKSQNVVDAGGRAHQLYQRF